MLDRALVEPRLAHLGESLETARRLYDVGNYVYCRDLVGYLLTQHPDLADEGLLRAIHAELETLTQQAGDEDLPEGPDLAAGSGLLDRSPGSETAADAAIPPAAPKGPDVPPAAPRDRPERRVRTGTGHAAVHTVGGGAEEPPRTAATHRRGLFGGAAAATAEQRRRRTPVPLPPRGLGASLWTRARS